MACIAAQNTGIIKLTAFSVPLGLQKNTYDPYLYTDFIKDPEDLSNTCALAPPTLCIYVNNFVFFSTSDAVEAKF